MFRGFCLTITGIPYVFTPGGVTTMPTAATGVPSGLWFGGEAGVEIADGFLVADGLRWSERAKPLDGDIEVDALTFKLRDAKATSGIAAGYHLFTWLATKSYVNIVSTPLSFLLAQGGLSFTVGSGASLDSFPRYVWLNREAIYCDSRASNVVTVNASGRGRLGTKDVAHTVSANANLYPEVFTAPPWVQRRKVVLWGIRASDGKVVVLWIGFCVRAPRLSGEGGTYELPCDPYLQVLKDSPIGSTEGVARILGYGSTNTTGSSMSAPALFRLKGQYHVNAYFFADITGSHRTWEAMVSTLRARWATASTARGGLIDLQVTRSDGSASIDAEISGTTPFTIQATWLGRAGPQVTSFARTGSRQRLSTSIEEIPASVYVLDFGAPVRWCLGAVAGLPSLGAAADSGTGMERRTTQAVLRTAYDAKWWIDVTGISASDDDSTYGPNVLGYTDFRPRSVGLERPSNLFARNLPPFQAALRATVAHWAHGIRRVVLSSTLGLVPDADEARDWSWDSLTEVGRATQGLNARREWTFDGRRTFGDLLHECCALFGVTPVTRSGLYSLFVWSWPLANGTETAFDATDIIGTPTWSTWDEGFANRISVRSDAVTVDAVDAGSLARYGPGRKMEVSLGGIDQQSNPVGDPAAFARDVLGRMALWANPLSIARFKVPLASLASVELGEVVALSEWMLPDGDGGRGLVSHPASVVSRSVDIDDASVEVEAILWPRLAHGYAPCAKISSVVSGTVVEIAQDYVRGTYDYAGGDDGLGGTSAGSQSLFTAGDLVQFIVRDSTTSTVESRVVSSLAWTGTAWRMTLTVALSAGMQTAIGAGWVDVRVDRWSTPPTTAQKLWMFVGSESTFVIDSTAEPARPIAP